MRRRANTRLGMLGILLLVIALCLAVLGLLVALTAQSERVMTERHAETVSADAACEAGAQAFLAQLDSWLARASANRMPAGQMAAALEQDAPTLMRTLSGASSQSERSEALEGFTAEVHLLSVEELAEQSERALRSSPRCGLRAMFSHTSAADAETATTLARRSLNATVLIYDDYTYGITDWKTTTEWSADATDMKLWEG